MLPCKAVAFILAYSLSGRMADYNNTNGNDCGGDTDNAVDYGIDCDIALFHIQPQYQRFRQKSRLSLA